MPTEISSYNSQVITCKAVVCWGIGEEGKVEEIQVEPPKTCEVRVKMLYASICHTDILITQGHPVPLFPRVLGHEGVGVVESVGEAVREVKEGDTVIPTFLSECEECENCVSGKANMCLKYPFSLSGVMEDGTSRMSVKGQKLYHFFSCSTWSEYMVVNVNYLVKLDLNPEFPLPHASFLSCGFSTGYGAPWKEAKLEKGSTVAVIGLGAVGLGAVEGARVQGASRIIGVDKNERKREKGKAFGMTDFINPDDHQSHENDDRKSVSQLINDLTDGMGVDYCFECSGFAPFINEALEATKLGKGAAIVLGTSIATRIEINTLSLLGGRTLKGSLFGGLKTKTDLPVIVQTCINKDIQLDQLLTHQVPLVDFNQALELLKHPDCVKVVIKI